VADNERTQAIRNNSSFQIPPNIYEKNGKICDIMEMLQVGKNVKFVKWENLRTK
jgi:hypothetical protein